MGREISTHSDEEVEGDFRRGGVSAGLNSEVNFCRLLFWAP
jgi:hypothetical protein